MMQPTYSFLTVSTLQTVPTGGNPSSGPRHTFSVGSTEWFKPSSSRAACHWVRLMLPFLSPRQLTAPLLLSTSHDLADLIHSFLFSANHFRSSFRSSFIAHSP